MKRNKPDGEDAASGEGETKAAIIDGKAMAATIRGEIAVEVKQLTEKLGRAPGLAVVIVGERKDSQTYVRNKVRACGECGIASQKIELPENVSEEEVVKRVKALNEDASLDGILVQLPLPKHIDEAKVLDCISVDKDVDGFHPTNIGLLAMRGREPSAKPCTPAAIIEILSRSGVPITGALAVIVGRSNVVGMPVAHLLLQRDATVQILHTKTPKEEVERAIRSADILVACAGQARVVKGEWVKPGATVIDVGINPVDDPSQAKGYRLVGDVDFEAASKRAGRITPVPGGVGPMTIAMLMLNTLKMAEKKVEGAGGGAEEEERQRAKRRSAHSALTAEGGAQAGVVCFPPENFDQH